MICSPKRRAIETVEPLFTRLGLEPEIDPGFDEIDRGASVYLPTERLISDGGDYWQAVVEQRWADIGWDSPEEFATRVTAAFVDLVERRPGQRVVLAAHGGTIRFILAHVAGLSGAGGFVSDYASISRVEVNEAGGASVFSINETAHFDVEHRTVRGVMNAGSMPGGEIGR